MGAGDAIGFGLHQHDEQPDQIIGSRTSTTGLSPGEPTTGASCPAGLAKAETGWIGHSSCRYGELHEPWDKALAKYCMLVSISGANSLIL